MADFGDFFRDAWRYWEISCVVAEKSSRVNEARGHGCFGISSDTQMRRPNRKRGRVDPLRRFLSSTKWNVHERLRPGN
jgi:hypothetical protein